MDDSKLLVKNKSWVERLICASYLHKETTYFYSHYLKNFMLSPQNRRNEIPIESERCPSFLYIFNQLGCRVRKKLNHWLTYKKWNFARVHVLINCTEVKSYLE